MIAVDHRLPFTEHIPQTLSADRAREVSSAIDALRPVLRPRFHQVLRLENQVEVRNLIGTVRLDSGAILEIEPKVPVDLNWAEAAVQLLEDSTRISVTGSQRSSQAASRPDLTTAIAFEYARRLERALAAEGPIQVFERQQHNQRRLAGHLLVTRWVKQSVLDPSRFPVERDDLTVANDFSRGLSIVAGYFRRSVLDPNLVSRLRRLESAILPGQPLPSFVNPSIAQRRVPPQWRRYRAAWDIAAAVLRNRSVIGDPGHSVGLEVALEPWPLLETLLLRSLHALAAGAGVEFDVPAKTIYPLLLQGPRTRASVEPDAVLRQQGQVVATFEAKYTNPDAVPSEAHIYQALTAAAVRHSPLAVLVYPGEQAPEIFDVTGFNGRPARLATVGLDLYRYQREGGAEERAKILQELVSARSVPTVAV